MIFRSPSLDGRGWGGRVNLFHLQLPAVLPSLDCQVVILLHLILDFVLPGRYRRALPGANRLRLGRFRLSYPLLRPFQERFRYIAGNRKKRHDLVQPAQQFHLEFVVVHDQAHPCSCTESRSVVCGDQGRDASRSVLTVDYIAGPEVCS